MNGSMLAAVFTGLLLLWRLVLDYVPMYPLNDLTRKTARSRNRDWTVHYAPLFLAFLLCLSGNRLSVVLGFIIACLYATVQVVTWWLPYVKGGTQNQKARWDGMYGKTHRILPRISDHTVPDTSHVITGLLTLAVVISMAGFLWTGSSSAGPGENVPANASPDATQKPDTPAQAAFIETAFTQAGEQPDQLLIQTIQNTKETLDIAINAINHEKIVQAIIQARINGVTVRVITDRNESAGAAQADKLKSLIAAGIPVKENARRGLMNLKLALFDDEAGATGSFNYTENASTNNDEMLVIIRDKETVSRWKQQFEAMWNDTENFIDKN